ncbi:toprim domain protein [Aquibacillus albus]|uniref:Toprim domain protein n=2 Tax=Aquibacillus albus TaxID=1168171 RepID=A0ABS2MYN0_9BACI|nr:toprim domain protein [Aquibacillus albus]
MYNSNIAITIFFEQGGLMESVEKVIIVEGRTDKQQIEKIIDEEVQIICTNGTLGVERLEELLIEYDLDNKEVFILVDEDKAGKKLRKQLSIELPHAEHIYIDKTFREVAATPESALATALVSRHFMINPIFLL